MTEANKDKTKAYVFGDANDKARVAHFIELLQRHQITVHRLKEDYKVNGKKFGKDWAFVVPANQSQYR
ncbi:MAG: hypothetical protein ACPG3Z_01690, partial [Saprospiraceae bacterium]